MSVAGGTAVASGETEVRPEAPTTFGVAFGGPTASSWREQALTRIAEIEDLAEAFRPRSKDRSELGHVLAERIHRHLQTARDAAEGKPGPGQRKRRGWTRFKALVGGSPLERTASNIDAAEADLLRIAPAEHFDGQLPSMLTHVRAHLPIDDPRRQSMESLCNPSRVPAATAT